MLSPFRTDVARQIWLLSIEMGASLLPVEYVNTKDNDVADQESRELDQDDWAISDAVWALVEGAFGPHDWDRFAPMENRRCTLYTAKRYQPECHWPQALSQPWEGRNNYCCPPESQLLKVLQLIRVSKAEATVIAPTYQGRWWPLLQELLRETGSTSCRGGVSSRPVRACRTVAAAGLSAAAPVCSVPSKRKGFVAEAPWSTGEYEIARILDERKDQFLIEWSNYESPMSRHHGRRRRRSTIRRDAVCAPQCWKSGVRFKCRLPGRPMSHQRVVSGSLVQNDTRLQRSS